MSSPSLFISRYLTFFIATFPLRPHRFNSPVNHRYSQLSLNMFSLMIPTNILLAVYNLSRILCRFVHRQCSFVSKTQTHSHPFHCSLRLLILRCVSESSYLRFQPSSWNSSIIYIKIMY